MFLIFKYPFLSDIWNSYNFDKPMDYSSDNFEILRLCNNRETYETSPTEKHKNICKDLLKNLKILSNNNYSNIDTFFTGCKNLNNWLYFKEKELAVSSDIVNKIFQAYKQIKKAIYHSHDCDYYTFDKRFNESEKLINLRIFNYNFETIQRLLKDSIKSQDCKLIKYVYECVDVYKKMNITYRFPHDCNSSQHKNACDIMKEFNQLYSSYINKKHGILHNFPELSSDTPTNIIDGCSSQENAKDPSLEESSQTDTSMRGVVSPVLSAIAGIPPFLVLIYKVNIIFT
ncbi:hypothetical protein PVBG_05946 [Plasmodium vivax Brazil I]|uniref:Uncharacterized protein n=1 Tax=Plasmodium vivax (strain Brazil I) TaxID=1033975 RepID=A0A0J9SKC1_PLAV1|nr:hypothetical protein PVBG_05946 [Plasmodium vivax Brazil I]